MGVHLKKRKPFYKKSDIKTKYNNGVFRIIFMLVGYDV